MALIFVELEQEKEALNFLNRFKANTSEINMVSNPFTSHSKIKEFKDKLMFAVDITPVYPPAYLFGLIPFGFGLFFGINWLMIAGITLFWVIGFFWTDIFYKIMLLIGLRKNGYKSKVRFISVKAGLRCFIWDK